MRLPRTALIPVLTIVAGGTVGVLLTVGSLALRSASDDVAAPGISIRVVVSSKGIEPDKRIEPERIEPQAPVAARPGTVAGQITDAQTGGSIAAAQVFIPSLDMGGLTQQNGRYLLQNVPAGTHTLSVARIGYGTMQMQITVRGGQTVEQNFALSDAAPSSPYRWVPTPSRFVPARR
ncbi:MAG: carboxypeptidase-like regulatory domain-containing protein [Gemmatimonadetes bacterium]|nr:carboxypeptidase-like regulatory domain-containing protein [Gemmatimonadota bacterium]